jgi:hypothetical protein
MLVLVAVAMLILCLVINLINRMKTVHMYELKLYLNIMHRILQIP